MPDDAVARDGRADPGPLPTHAMSEEMLGAFEGVVVDVHAKRSAATSPPPTLPLPRGWAFAAAGTWTALIVALLFPPAFSRPEAARPFTPPTELREASMRFGLWLAQHRVDGFIARNARVPSRPGEAGIDDPAISIEPGGARSYTLVGRDGDLTITLRSDMAADAFLGSSLESLASSPSYQQAGTPGRTTAR